jgi:2-polyprenyl-3-methyl-5-hydroxy-6-metoxy-1,4-benzoquinol methylase
VRFILPPREHIHANNEKDPLPYYYKPLLGPLYRQRLQIGLDMFPRSCEHILEIGVGSGILIPTLTAHCKAYTGVDLELAAGLQSLVNPKCSATFQTLDLLDPKAFENKSFDVIACFSVLEHIEDSDAAARSLARLLSRGGTLITGYPMVNRLMNAAFTAIAYHKIENDHVSTPAKIHAALARHLTLTQRVSIPRWMPISTALYQCSAWTH